MRREQRLQSFQIRECIWCHKTDMVDRTGACLPCSNAIQERLKDGVVVTNEFERRAWEHHAFHTKPVAVSLAILYAVDEIEYVEGSTEGSFHIIPFCVKTFNGGFICSRTKLHEYANKFKQGGRV